jgi:PhnB protein
MSTVTAMTTHLVVSEAASASQWYQRAFGARELTRITLPDDRLIHVEMRIGPVSFMLADEFPEHGAVAPRPDSDLPAVFYLHVSDVDAVWQGALGAGAVVTRPLDEVFWGEREGQLRDPYGYRWGLTQRVRDVPLAEMAEAARHLFT